MENWIDTFTEFLIVSSALLLALGALSCLILHAFKIKGKAKLLICSMLLIMPVAFPIGSLIPDRHKVPLPAEKLQTILPASLESGISTFTYDRDRYAGPVASQTTADKPDAITSSIAQTAIQGFHVKTPAALTWKQVVAGVWICLFGFILIRFFFFFLKIRLLIKYAEDVADQTILELFQRCRKETGLRQRPRLLVVHHTMTPMAVGVLRPAVILPARLLIPEFREGLRFTLLHELKHLQRRDNWWLLLEMLVGAVYFFHPVIFWAKQKIHEEWEHICDRHVVQVTNRPSSYADFLLHEIWSHGRRTSPSGAVPLIFKTRKTTKRVRCILERMKPTLFAKIRDRIAVSTVFVCFLSLFFCTVAPFANVNENEIEPGQIEWPRSNISDSVSSTMENTKNLEPVSIDNEAVPEDRKLRKSKHEKISLTETESVPAATDASPDPNVAEISTQEKSQDAKVESPSEPAKENIPKESPINKEKLSICTEILPHILTEKTGIPADEENPPGAATLFETSNLHASIDPWSLLAQSQTSQDVSAEPAEKHPELERDTAREAENQQQEQAATGMKNEPVSDNVSIPMGARIFAWNAIDDRNIIITTRFYGSFKVTLGEACPDLSKYKKLSFNSNWPYELDVKSSVILPNDDAYKIQKLVPYGKMITQQDLYQPILDSALRLYP